MDQPSPGQATHRIVVCTRCKSDGEKHRPGHSIISKLQRAFTQAGVYATPQGFEVSGEACLAGCDNPCTVAYLGQGKTCYLFGDISSEADYAALVEFAADYQRSRTGWTRDGDRLAALRGKILARVPSLTTARRKSKKQS